MKRYILITREKDAYYSVTVNAGHFPQRCRGDFKQEKCDSNAENDI